VLCVVCRRLTLCALFSQVVYGLAYKSVATFRIDPVSSITVKSLQDLKAAADIGALSEETLIKVARLISGQCDPPGNQR